MKPVIQYGKFCTLCESLCYPYEQGLCCGCDHPWITEVIHEEEYPDKWINCKSTIEFPNHPTTYWECYNLPEPYELKKP